MASGNQSYHQAKLSSVINSDEEAGSNALGTLVEQYITAKETTGSHAYAASAKSVLHRWAAWMDQHDYEMGILDDPQEGPRVLNQYALELAGQVRDNRLSVTTAERYFAYISACLSFGVRQGQLNRNPALTTAAKENLPEENRKDRTNQQFWSDDQREAIVAFADEQAQGDTDSDASQEWLPVRNQALVRLLAYSGVRGAEVLSHPKDDREGRNGLRWKNVDFDAGTLLVFGKSQSWERTPLPAKCAASLQRLKDVQQPPSDEWPVFTTGHRPSLYQVAKDATAHYDKAITSVDGRIWDLLREQDIAPPALTTGGARKVMQGLTRQTDIEVSDGYLKLHGGHRGLGDLLYRKDRGHAQDILRHKDLATTQRAYQHIDAEERRAQLDAHLEGAE